MHASYIPDGMVNFLIPLTISKNVSLVLISKKDNLFEIQNTHIYIYLLFNVVHKEHIL